MEYHKVLVRIGICIQDIKERNGRRIKITPRGSHRRERYSISLRFYPFICSSIISPRCCGFKSQVPEGCYHAWVTSDVRIPQPEDSLSPFWSFNDTMNSRASMKSMIDVPIHDVGHACKIKYSIRFSCDNADSISQFRPFVQHLRMTTYSDVISSFQKFHRRASLFAFLLFCRIPFARVLGVGILLLNIHF